MSTIHFLTCDWQERVIRCPRREVKTRCREIERHFGWVITIHRG
jgi:hypothetical protein